MQAGIAGNGVANPGLMRHGAKGRSCLSSQALVEHLQKAAVAGIHASPLGLTVACKVCFSKHDQL